MSRREGGARRESESRGGEASVQAARALTTPTFYGVTTLANANGYASANGAGEQGNAVVGFIVDVLMSPRSQSVTSKDRWIAGTNDGTGTTYGWQLITRTTNSTIRASIRQTGSGAFVNTSSYTLTAADLHKVMRVTLEVDVVGLVMRLRVNGALVGTETAITGYAVPDTAVPFEVGKLGSTSGADGLDIYGVVTAHGVITSGELAAHHAACLAAADIVPLVGAGLTATHTWSVKTAVLAAASAATAPNLTDSTGSSTLTKAGSPTIVTRVNPPWA